MGFTPQDRCVLRRHTQLSVALPTACLSVSHDANFVPGIQHRSHPAQKAHTGSPATPGFLENLPWVMSLNASPSARVHLSLMNQSFTQPHLSFHAPPLLLCGYTISDWITFTFTPSMHVPNTYLPLPGPCTPHSYTGLRPKWGPSEIPSPASNVWGSPWEPIPTEPGLQCWVR